MSLALSSLIGDGHGFTSGVGTFSAGYPADTLDTNKFHLKADGLGVTATFSELDPEAGTFTITPTLAFDRTKTYTLDTDDNCVQGAVGSEDVPVVLRPTVLSAAVQFGNTSTLVTLDEAISDFDEGLFDFTGLSGVAVDTSDETTIRFSHDPFAPGEVTLAVGSGAFTAVDTGLDNAATSGIEVTIPPVVESVTVVVEEGAAYADFSLSEPCDASDVVQLNVQGAGDLNATYVSGDGTASIRFRVTEGVDGQNIMVLWDDEVHWQTASDSFTSVATSLTCGEQSGAATLEIDPPSASNLTILHPTLTFEQLQDIGRGRVRALIDETWPIDIYDIDFTRCTDEFGMVSAFGQAVATAIGRGSNWPNFGDTWAEGFSVPEDHSIRFIASTPKENEDQHVVNWISIASPSQGPSTNGFSSPVWNDQDWSVYTGLVAEVIALGGKYHIPDRLCGVIEPAAQYVVQTDPVELTCSPLGPPQLQALAPDVYDSIQAAWATNNSNAAGLGGWIAPYIGAANQDFEPGSEGAYEEWWQPIFDWGFRKVVLDVAGDMSSDGDAVTYLGLQNMSNRADMIFEPYADTGPTKNWVTQDGFGGIYALEANALAGLHGGKNRASSPARNYVLLSDDDSLANGILWIKRGYVVVTGLYHTVRQLSESQALLAMSWDTDLISDHVLSSTSGSRGSRLPLNRCPASLRYARTPFR